MKTVLKLIGVMGTLVALAAMTACGGPNGGDSKFKVSVYAGSLISLPDYVALSSGYFAKEGLDVQLVPVSDGPAASAALASGSVNVIANTPVNAVRLSAQGQKMSAIAQVLKYPTFVWVAGPKWAARVGQVPSPDNAATTFKGAKIAVPAQGSEAQLATKALMAEAGMNPDSDATFVPVAPGATTVAALQSGQVDVVATWDPTATMLADMPGAMTLLDMRVGKGGSGPVQEQPGAMRFAQAGRLAADPGKYMAYQRAINAALDQMRDPAEVEKTTKAWVDAGGIDPALAKRILAYNAPTFSSDMDPEAIVSSLKTYFNDLNDPLASKVNDITVDDMFWDKELSNP